MIRVMLQVRFNKILYIVQDHSQHPLEINLTSRDARLLFGSANIFILPSFFLQQKNIPEQTQLPNVNFISKVYIFRSMHRAGLFARHWGSVYRDSCLHGHWGMFTLECLWSKLDLVGYNFKWPLFYCQDSFLIWSQADSTSTELAMEIEESFTPDNPKTNTVHNMFSFILEESRRAVSAVISLFLTYKNPENKIILFQRNYKTWLSE